jgi:mannose-6-phosphate isomerase-like protein (cupin superfamily)
MRQKFSLTLIALVCAFVPASAQAPTCNKCPGTYIPSEEIQAYIKRSSGIAVSDQQVRAIEIGKGHVAVGVVHREKLTATLPNVAEHDLVTEVYHVIDGSGTLLTGPDLVDPQRRSAGDVTVRELNGPGHDAKSIRNPQVHNVKAGDVVVIPAGTGHWWTKIDDHITYLMVRIDPDAKTPIKTESQSKADLASPPK